MSSILTRGLERSSERWCLGACMSLCIFYLAVLAGLQRAGTRFGDAFLAQREAVRVDHLRHAPFPLDCPVILSEHGKTAPEIALLHGWLEPEAWGAWTDGARAELAIMLPQPRSRFLVLRMRALIVLPPGGTQVIGLHADGQAVGEWRIQTGSAAFCALLPPAVLARGGLLRVGIGIGTPHAPPGGADHRSLGLGLERVELSTSSASCAPEARPPSN